MTEAQVKAPGKNVGGRPRKKVDTNSPEFKAAVAEQTAALREGILAEILPTLQAQLGAARAQVGSEAQTETVGASASDNELMRSLAVSIAELTDQGSNRKRVAPEILAKREESRARMLEAILKAKASKQQPWYTLVAKTYLNEILLDPFTTDPKTKAIEPTTIMWEGIPNEAMRPLAGCSVAEEIFEHFMGWIGGFTGRTKRDRSKGLGMDADLRAYGVTPGGMVVKGMSAAQHRTMGNLADSNNGKAQDVNIPGAPAPTPYTDGLVVGNPADPRTKLVRVLGTVHPAAEQNNFAQNRN